MDFRLKACVAGKTINSKKRAAVSCMHGTGRARFTVLCVVSCILYEELAYLSICRTEGSPNGCCRVRGEAPGGLDYMCVCVVGRDRVGWGWEKAGK